MIIDIGIEFVLITALFILTMFIVAHSCSFLYSSFVENLSIEMEEAPVLEGKVRHWISSMSHSGLKVITSIQIVEPYSEFDVSNSGRAKVVKLSHLDFIGQQVGYCMGA